MDLIIEFAIETAMRRSEIFNLQHANIDFREKVAHLIITKNGEQRDVPLSKKAILTIERQPKNEVDRVFGSWRHIDAVTNNFRIVAG